MKVLQVMSWKHVFLLLTWMLQIVFVQPTYADFVNGGFEDPYTPSGANSFNPITGWTLTGYHFGGATAVPPTSMVDLNLTIQTSPGGISDIIVGPMQTIDDYFLVNTLPVPTPILPITGSQSGMVNLRSIDAPLTMAGNSAPKPPVPPWTLDPSQATSFSQQIIVQASDIDPTDQLVHIRLVAAPVVENPGHTASQQPFFAVQLNNITTGRIGANPLFFQWHYSNQPGVPWFSVTTAGTNQGSNTSYQYTDPQSFDIAPGNAFIHVGDVVELVVIASGCSPGGHDGHLYLDDVHTFIATTLWVAATGPGTSTPGDNVTYTYTYTNSSATAVDNVQVIANLPLQGNPSTSPVPHTNFVSVTNPTTGGTCSGTGPVTCSIGTLQPGQTGTFQMTVNIPSSWTLGEGPVNNGDYPISGTGVNALLGPLVQTNLESPSSLSNLVANASGLPTSADIGVPYSGTFSCSNIPTITATADATDASCDITNLPTGLAVTGCTISPANTPFVEPATIPSDQTVTCSVGGTPTTTGANVVTVTTNAANNSDSVDNVATTTIAIGLVEIPATLDGSPILSPAVICCGRPVLLGPLPLPGPGPTTYFISARTGDAICKIGHSGSQTFLKMNAKHGSCSVVGMKDGVFSAPFTVVSP